MRLSKLVKHFATLKELAEALEVSPSTVGEWKKKGGQIPYHLHDKARKLLESKPVHIDGKLDFEEVLVQFGSVQAIAEAADVHPKTAYNWKSAGYIPSASADKLRRVRSA